MSPRYEHTLNAAGSRRYPALAPTLEDLQDGIGEATVFPSNAAELKQKYQYRSPKKTQKRPDWMSKASLSPSATNNATFILTSPKQRNKLPLALTHDTLNVDEDTLFSVGDDRGRLESESLIKAAMRVR